MESSVELASIPVAETLLDPTAAQELWPVGAARPGFIDQITSHATNSAAATRLIESLDPDSLPEQERPTDDQTLQLGYTALTSMLDNPDTARLLLYLPFGLLDKGFADGASAAAQREFTEIYRDTWLSLLSEHDVRANFVDGDVLETQYRTGDLERVVKAAHFVPALIARGVLHEGEVTRILDGADPLLQDSLMSGLRAHYGDETPSVANQADAYTSARRRAWLEKRALENEIAVFAADSQPYLQQAHPSIEDLRALSSANPFHAQAVAEAVYEFILRGNDRGQAAGKYQPLFDELLVSKDIAAHNRAISIFRRLFHLGVYSAEALAERDITTPTLEGPMSQNLTELSSDLLALRQKAQRIESDPTASKYFYPVFTVGGSRLKGYGQTSSDVDMCMFVKPEVISSEQRMVQALAAQVVDPYEPITFWLEERGDGLAVRDTEQPHTETADRYWTHVLFGSAWVGDTGAIRNVQQKLLPTYFTESNQQDHKWHLERIEQDLLQYRLMHRGYRQHFPLSQPEAALLSPWVDGESTFWDPGYRQLAAKLFARYVFIPRIPA